MKNIIVIIIVALTIYSCNSVENVQHSNEEIEYFEGEIYYSRYYESIKVNLKPEQINNIAGARMVLTFKEGSHRKDFYSANDTIISQRYLSLKEGESFSVKPHEDTILWFDITENDSKSTFKRRGDTIIDKQDCISLTVKTLTPDPWNNGGEMVINSEYFFAKKLIVNPKWFQHYYEGNYNEMINATNSLAIEKVENGPYWTTVTKCDSIVWRKVNESEISTDFLKARPRQKL